jgi:hypothetical protein
VRPAAQHRPRRSAAATTAANVQAGRLSSHASAYATEPPQHLQQQQQQQQDSKLRSSLHLKADTDAGAAADTDLRGSANWSSWREHAAQLLDAGHDVATGSAQQHVRRRPHQVVADNQG